MKICEVCQAAFVSDFSYCPLDGTALVAEPNDHLIGTQIDRFRIEAHIATGRLGRVYRARLGERRYALKVLIGDLSTDLSVVKRFRRAAHRLSKVRHENVAQVVEFDTTPTGLAFVASELAPGRSLADLLREGALSPERAEAIAKDVVAGVDAALAQGVIYRDLRADIIRVDGDRAKIADFSLGLRDESLRYVEPEVNDVSTLGRRALRRLVTTLVPGWALDDLRPAVPKPAKVPTDDLAITEASKPKTPEPELVTLDDVEAIVEVVVGKVDDGTPWPETSADLAALCVELKLMSATERKTVLDEVQATNKRLLQVVSEMMPQRSDRIVKALASHLGLEQWTKGFGAIHPRVLATIPKALSLELGVVPYALRAKDDGNSLFVAVSDPVEKPTRQALEAMINHPIVWRLGLAEDIDAALEEAYGKEVRSGVPATMRIRLPDR